MSPEYAFHGRFLMKSDVFSFGVLILEKITGKKRRGYSEPDRNLLGHVWRLWKEERTVETIDTALGDSYIIAEVLRCINVALLCVQQHPDDRTNMSSVLSMLAGDSTLPQPNQPGYFIERKLHSTKSTSSKHESQSNEFTITLLELC
ncbi:S-locus-specific glycoprotein S6, putative isoform 1 [Theobroma cacao]|uniref:S-locus-specific glycoprotein S6, putative isoform 1 n=1 Tax=Theobroma cacao TaxID=3641 RepID=A0A061F789_THECC|nr:S-locus-specific glycoprotein S6, putative isoform 1 [Theobroma cacao]